MPNNQMHWTANALVIYMKQHAGDRWLEENREAIAKYNELVDANGVFSDGVRRF